jgi:hypothetical protein
MDWNTRKPCVRSGLLTGWRGCIKILANLKTLLKRLVSLLILLTTLALGDGPKPLINDAFIPPDWEGLSAAQKTSEFMIGSIAVSIILPESDGSVDPSTEDWTFAERWHVHNEIVDALNWWADREPRANLSFIIEEHYLLTGYEPIARPSSDMVYWVEDMMQQLGYNEPPSYFDRVRNYNNDLRDKYQTDWAFTMFIVDSSEDKDNQFSDARFAYAFLGGPFMVMTYGNNGYGPNNMDMVCAHEMGHIFHALDQYSGSLILCSYISGCAGIKTRNSDYRPLGKEQDCVHPEPSIMKWAPAAYPYGLVDKWARGQIGWWDADLDDIFDCIDPDVTEPYQLFFPVFMKG